MSDEQRPESEASSSRDDPIVEPENLRAAIESTARTEGWEAAADVFQQHWDLYATRAPEALLEGLKGLPGEVFVARPSMLVAADYLHQVAAGQDPRRFHDGARDLYRGVRQPRELIDSLIALTGRAAGARTAGTLDKARQRAVEARRMLERAEETARVGARGALPHLMFQWGRCLEVADAEGAIVEYEQSHELGTLTEQGEIARRAAASLAWLLAERGRLGDARTWLARAQATDRDSPRYDAPLHLTAALIAADELEDDLAAQELARVDDESVGEYWGARLWVRAMIARGPLAPFIVSHAIAGESDRHVTGLVREGANRRYLVRAATALAVELGEDASLPADIDEPSAADMLRRSLALHRSGAHAAARTQLRTALAVGLTPRDEAAAQLQLAAAERALDNEDAAKTAFCRAHALIGHEDLLRTYLALGRAEVKALCALTGLPLPERVATSTRSMRGIPREVGRGPDLSALTRRERELLVLIADDRSFAEIAEALFISPNTVKTLTRSLYRKLGVHSRAEAAALARRT